MQLFVNEEPIAIDPAGDLAAILEKIGIPLSKGLAVAVNDEVVPREVWPEKILSDQDRITLIRPTQGG